MTDSRTRNAAAARDDAVARIGRVTRWIGTAAGAGALIAAAGFAHLIPTHLPQLNVGGAKGGSGGSSSNGSVPQPTSPSGGSGNSSSGNSSTSGGLQGPATSPGNAGSTPSHVTSGGS